jgi:hypothetical protein
VSAADHVKTEHRFTDWCEWSQFISVPSTVLVFFEKSNRYDIDNDCVDDGGKEHSAIDHVLISQDLNKAVTRVAYQHDFKPSEFCDITQNVTSYYSDHWPIFVEFELSALYKTWKMSVLSRKSINLWLSLSSKIIWNPVFLFLPYYNFQTRASWITSKYYRSVEPKEANVQVRGVTQTPNWFLWSMNQKWKCITLNLSGWNGSWKNIKIEDIT